MKLILKIAAAILLAGGIGWAIFDFDSFRHTFVGYSQEELDRSSKQLETQIALSARRMDAELTEAKAQLAETRFGEGALYRLCHEYEPTTKANKARCKNLDDRMKRADANDAKHPW